MTVRASPCLGESDEDDGVAARGCAQTFVQIGQHRSAAPVVHRAVAYCDVIGVGRDQDAGIRLAGQRADEIRNLDVLDGLFLQRLTAS